MIQPWPVIADRYRAALRAHADEPFWQAVEQVGGLAAHIASGPLAGNLLGWMSMYDLAIQRSDEHPFVAPYLRVSPLSSGTVEFRMIATRFDERQWRHEVAAGETIARCDEYLAQLGWAG